MASIVFPGYFYELSNVNHQSNGLVCLGSCNFR